MGLLLFPVLMLLLSIGVPTSLASSSYQNTAFQSVYQNFGRMGSSPSPSDYATSSTWSLFESRDTVLDTIPHISAETDSVGDLDSTQVQQEVDDDLYQIDSSATSLSMLSLYSSWTPEMFASTIASITDATATASARSFASASSSVPAPAPSPSPAPASSAVAPPALAPAPVAVSLPGPPCPSEVVGASCPIDSAGAECFTQSMKCFCTHSAAMASQTMFMWSCVSLNAS